LDPSPSLTLCSERAQLYAQALLRFHFIYGDFICWLSGKYTNRHRRWSQDFTTMVKTKARPLTEDYPVPDYPHAFWICTKGVPLRGNFTTPALQISSRNLYNNHPAVELNSASVEAKFVKEEQKLFHIHLPRFLISFLPGLVLAPLQWATRKKGQCCRTWSKTLNHPRDVFVGPTDHRSRPSSLQLRIGTQQTLWPVGVLSEHL
jgi:hypothetical protein